MGTFFPEIDLPSGCEQCKFAPIFITPRDGKFIKEQFCLIKNEMVQSAEVNERDEYPEEWWTEKHLEGCPGLPAKIVEEKPKRKRKTKKDKEEAPDDPGEAKQDNMDT